jgi:hypothetical protein
MTERGVRMETTFSRRILRTQQNKYLQNYYESELTRRPKFRELTDSENVAQSDTGCKQANMASLTQGLQ